MITAEYRGYGGVESVMNSLCNGLNNLGYETTIGAYSFLENPPHDIAKINITRFKDLKTNPNGRDFDIIHAHQAKMIYHSLFTSKPFVFHFHGANGFFQELLLKIILRICKNHVSKIIPVSQAASDQFTKMIGRFPGDVIYNAVDSEFFHPNLPQTFKKGTPQLLFVGNLYPTKNVLHILENMPKILELYPETHLQIVGNGKDYQNAKKVVKKKKLEKYVELQGSVSEEEKRLRYSSCDIYVSASRYDTYDLPSVEAMACGKPVVLSDIPPHKEILNLAKAGRIFSLSTKNDLTKKIQEVYEKRLSLSSLARNFAEEHDWESACKKLDKIYEELLA